MLHMEPRYSLTNVVCRIRIRLSRYLTGNSLKPYLVTTVPANTKYSVNRLFTNTAEFGADAISRSLRRAETARKTPARRVAATGKKATQNWETAFRKALSACFPAKNR